MLQDQYRESSKIENEYKKLLQAWNIELTNNPSTDIKKSKISRSEHIQFTLMHLFNGYLDQIWTDSQNMLQCAQAWANQTTEAYPSNAVFTMNILGLHLMKQSLRTRQEFFRIVDELNGILSAKDENESIFSASDSTISEEDFMVLHSTKYDHGYIDLEKEKAYTDQNLYDGAYNLEYSEQLSRKELSVIDKSPAESMTSIKFDMPIKLKSSPSTPIVGSSWSEMSRCHSKSLPADTEHVYISNDGQISQGHNIPCHICQGPFTFEKSISADTFQSLRPGTVDTTDDGKDREENCGSFEIASYYYNSESEDEEDIIEREFLLKKPNESSITFNKSINDNFKVHMENNGSDSTSSSIIHYDIETKQINKNKMRRSKRTIVHQRYGSSSTCLPQSACSSSYSRNYESDDENSEQMDKCRSSEHMADMRHVHVQSKIASFMKKSRSKNGTDVTEKNQEINTNTMLEYSANLKSRFNLCSVFFSRKQNKASTAN